MVKPSQIDIITERISEYLDSANFDEETFSSLTNAIEEYGQLKYEEGFDEGQNNIRENMI